MITKVAKNYGKLREQQLELITSQRTIELGGSIVDNNPEGYTDRTYNELTKIKMPLILDQIGRTPWTVEEVLKAMGPQIKGLVFQFARKRAGYQNDDAESLGLQAVLDALYTDRGVAWFGGHCYERVRSAIKRGAKTSGLIRSAERLKSWRDNITSANEAFGESEGTIAETLNGDYRTVRRERCGDYVGEGNKKVFVTTCTKGFIDKGLPTERKCDRCGGTGRIVKFEERHTTRMPDECADTNQRKQDLIYVWRALTADLPVKQIEVVTLLLGLDEGGTARTPNEVAEYLKAKYGMGSKNFVIQCRDKVFSKFRQRQSSNVDITEAIDRILSSLGEDTV